MKVNKPKSIESFLEALTAVKNSKRKAANLLFEENLGILKFLAYEQVLKNVKIILPRIQGGQINTAKAQGGAIEIDEEVKQGNHVSINGVHNDREPLLDQDNVMIAHIAGTIEVDEKPRLKKLLFRATRGKALTFF